MTLDSANDLFVVFSESSATLYASLAATEQPVGSAAGTWTSPVLLAAGAGVHNGATDSSGRLRWGDYSGAATDPANPAVVYLAGEYMASDRCPTQWGTAIGALTLAPVLPGGTAVPPTATAVPPAPPLPTSTPVPTNTPIPATGTPVPIATRTPVRATSTPVRTSPRVLATSTPIPATATPAARTVRRAVLPLRLERLWRTGGMLGYRVRTSPHASVTVTLWGPGGFVRRQQVRANPRGYATGHIRFPFRHRPWVRVRVVVRAAHLARSQTWRWTIR